MIRWLRTFWECDRVLFWLLAAFTLLSAAVITCKSVVLYYAITEPTHCRCR